MQCAGVHCDGMRGVAFGEGRCPVYAEATAICGNGRRRVTVLQQV